MWGVGGGGEKKRKIVGWRESGKRGKVEIWGCEGEGCGGLGRWVEEVRNVEDVHIFWSFFGGYGEKG